MSNYGLGNRNLTSEILKFTNRGIDSPAKFAAKNILSSSDLKLTSEQVDEEFDRLKNKAFGNPDDKLRDELDTFRRDRERISYQANEEDKIVQRLLAEIVYRKENERRASNELSEISYQLRQLDQMLVNARELEKKREFMKLLEERKALAKIEDNLYEQIVTFKDFYDKLELQRISGKGLTDLEQKVKRDRIQEVKSMKEQTDIERKRLQDNLSKIKNGNISAIDRNQTQLLMSNFSKKIEYDNYAPMTLYTIDKLKSKITLDSERLKEMRRQKEELLKKELLLADPDEFPTAQHPSYADMIQKFVLEIEGRQLTSEDKVARLSQIRENIVKYGVMAGLQKSKVRLKFDDLNSKQSQMQMEKLIGEIRRLKEEFINTGGDDVEYLNNLEHLEKFYIQAKEQMANLMDPLDAAIEQSRLQQQGDILGVSQLNNTTTSHVFGSQNGFDPVKSLLNPNYSAEVNQSFANQYTHKANETTGLKAQLEQMQQGANKINNILKFGNKTMTNMQLKFGGLNPGSLERAEAMMPTEEEKALIALTTQEKEAVKALSMIPADSEMYSYKLNQIKQMSTLKRELEKIVQEQKLSRMWKEYQGSSAAAEDQRKKMQIAERLKRNIFHYKAANNYDPNVGFVVDFEWMSGLPKKMEYVEIIYGVYSKGETLAVPKLIETHKTEQDTINTCKCIFDEQHHIYDVPPYSDALLIFEFQVHYQVGYSTGEKVETYGWTMVDLFDLQKNIKRGKWKCPIYMKPTNTNILIEEIRGLTRIDDVWFFFKILKPDDEEFMLDKQRALEATEFEHVVPTIHGTWEKKARLPFRFGMRDDGDELPVLNMEDLKESDEESLEESRPGTSESEKRRREEEERRRREDEERRRKEEEERKRIMNRLMNLSLTLNVSKGIKLTIYSIRYFTTRGFVKVSAALLDGANIILDEHARPCAYNTKEVEGERDITRNLRLGTSMMDNTNNAIQEEEAKAMEVRFDEVHIFYRNIPGLIVAREGNIDINLAFQVLVKLPRVRNMYLSAAPKEEESKINQSQMSPGMEGDQTVNQTVVNQSMMGEDEWKIESWYAVKVNNLDGSLNVGRFQQQLFLPPILRPPFDEGNITKLQMELDYQIEEYAYDANEVARQNIVIEKAPKKPREKRMKLGKVKVSKDALLNIDTRPFIINTKPQYHDRPFEKGNGIDFYIDAARFLPDNVTVTKIVLYLFGQNMDRILPPQAGLPELDSDVYNPVFRFRQELRAPFFDPTTMALISLETIDERAGSEVRIIGYSAINLFINAKTKEQPQKETDHDIILLNGYYQLPIFCQEPFRKRPFNMQRMVHLDRLPAASLLVRINQAPKTDDGLKVLGINDVPEKEWEKREVWVPMPDYHEGKYNTTFCQVRESEKDLFILRQQREKKKIRERALLLMTELDQNTEEKSDEDIHRWIDDKVQKNQATEIIDLMYFAKYMLQTGFKFALDGFHNVPDTRVNYFGLYFLNSTTNPAALYQDRYDSTRVNLNSHYDWNSPTVSPRFLDGFITYKDIPFDKNLTIIIDIRSIVIRKKKPVIKPVGWTALPIFSADGYVQSGIYQLPVFKGPAPKDIIAQLADTEPWDYLKELYSGRKPKLTFLEPMSAVVRLLDAQREGHFQHIYDYNRIQYKYLPEKKNYLYAYNAAVDTKLKFAKKLETIVPLKGNPKEYNKEITNNLIEIFGLKQYKPEI